MEYPLPPEDRIASLYSKFQNEKPVEERMAREDIYDRGYDAGYYVGKRDGYIEAITDILKYLEPHTNTPAIVIKRHIEEMKEEHHERICKFTSCT